MIGIVLVTHGQLADEFLSAMEHIVGTQDHTATICIQPDDDMEKRRADIVDAVASVENGDGVILLTDMFGGTPSNLAISVMGEGNVEVIAGVNLPMLIQLARARQTQTLEDAVTDAQEAGKKYISVASKLLADRKRKRSPSSKPSAKTQTNRILSVSRKSDDRKSARPSCAGSSQVC